jgi:tetratricopeptide (TPR) repeat protein
MGKNVSSQELIDDIENCLAQAVLSESREQRDTALAEARELAEKCVLANPDNPSCWFMAGLATYDSFAVDESYGSQVESYLKRALELDNKHQFARLYLGHYYYDIGRYEDALSHFERITEDYFLLADKAWRILKLHELILCCKLRLSRSDINVDSFRSLIQEFDRSHPDDVPVPLEMAETLAETKESPVWQIVNRTQVLRLFIDFVEKQGFKEALQHYIVAF